MKSEKEPWQDYRTISKSRRPKSVHLCTLAQFKNPDKNNPTPPCGKPDVDAITFKPEAVTCKKCLAWINRDKQ